MARRKRDTSKRKGVWEDRAVPGHPGPRKKLNGEGQREAGHLLVLIVQDVNFKEARLDLLRLAVGRQGFGSREPHFELRQPVLESVNLPESQAGKSAVRSQLRAELLSLFGARAGSRAL